MWLESSSLNTVNLEKKFTTVPEISNFSWEVTFLARPVRIETARRMWKHRAELSAIAGFLCKIRTVRSAGRAAIFEFSVVRRRMKTNKQLGTRLGGGGTAAAAPLPFRPGNPALCGSHPLVTTYYCRLGDLLCFVFIVCLLFFFLLIVYSVCSFSTLMLLVGSSDL